MPFNTRSYDLARQRAGSDVSFSMILVQYRRERMVRRVPAVLLLVPFEHREIDHPQPLKILRVEQLVPVVVLLRHVQPQLPARLIRPSLPDDAPSARPPTPAIISRSSSAAPDALAHLRHRAGIVFFEALRVVEDAQPALLSVRLDFVALLAADRAPSSGIWIATSGSPCGRQFRRAGLPRRAWAARAGRAYRCHIAAWLRHRSCAEMAR